MTAAEFIEKELLPWLEDKTMKSVPMVIGYLRNNRGKWQSAQAVEDMTMDDIHARVFKQPDKPPIEPFSYIVDITDSYGNVREATLIEQMKEVEDKFDEIIARLAEKGI